MGLRIERVSLRNFRNYRDFALDDMGGLTILVGPNAVGKTNVVEALQLLCAQGSFRHPRTDELVLEGQRWARAEARVVGDGRLLDLGFSVKEGRRSHDLNGKTRPASELRGLVPAVVFTPDDLDLAKGPMGRRRDAVDAVGSQLSSNHHLIKRDFEKVLQHKNRLLRDEAPQDLVDSIDELMVTCGAQLCAYRSALVRRLGQRMAACYADIVADSSPAGGAGCEKLEVCYVPSWEEYDPRTPRHFEFTREEAREAIEGALERRRAEERERRRCLVGPHVDKISFFLAGRNVASFASQGQQRSVVLAFKIAEASLVEEMLGQKPVLLLDDVMSELDAARRRSLVDFILASTQSVITSTTLEYFEPDLVARAQLVRLPYEKEGSS